VSASHAASGTNLRTSVSWPGLIIEWARRLPSRSYAVPILQLFALAVMLLPSDAVIGAIGAQGYAAALVGMFAFVAYLAAVLFGLHDPLRHRHPIRGLLCLVWISVLASYIAMDRGTLTVSEGSGADRLLLQLVVITGVALVAAEFVTSVSDMRRVLRALTWGGAFCGVVAVLQYWISLDITPYLRDLPGFSINAVDPGIVQRGSLNRVSGTSITAIELGVVAGMLLPLAIYLGIYDTDRPAWRRWAPVALIAIAVPISVSRSGVIATVLALAVLVVLMPTRQRLAAFCLAPLGLTAIFMSAPGVIGTLATFFGAASADSSVQARLHDYPEVERLVNQAPWLGQGGGTYLPVNPMLILDNQYLKTAIELGLIGVIVLAAFFLVPLSSALVARRRSGDPELRLLCAALAAATLAAGVCSLTFDSLSFPMFANVYALLIGLIGACWRLTAAGKESATARLRLGRGNSASSNPLIRG